MPDRLPLGPVMVDVAGTRLDAAEADLLRHPLVGGVILFARNYESPEQLRELTSAIHALREPALMIAVDHEGGRVQRFREGFTRIPPMRKLGAIFDREPALAENLARALAIVIASELRAHGVDFTFAPVVDLDFGASGVIGDRAFHTSPEATGRLAAAFVDGLARLGMGAVAKHFPGHGFVRADSHVAVPVDERALPEIEAADVVPYRTLIGQGLAGVMPAHVIYPKVDERPAGFSPVWLKQILRGRLGFDGLIFSDDLSMEGASVAGGITSRARAALAAGCDMVLVCNAPESARTLLAELEFSPLDPARAARMATRVERGPGYEEAVATYTTAEAAGLFA